jgi:hypothetical protein
MNLLRRIVAEKRAVALPLLIALVVNVAVYVLVVHPLRAKSLGAAERAAASDRALAMAERDQGAARDLVSGKARADEALTTFFGKVLPADLTAARRLTYTKLPELAHKSGVTFESRQNEIEKVPGNARLGRLRVRMALRGDYENFREFIYELESSPEFIIIDDVSLSQPEPDKPLVVSLELSTYYRLGPDGV